MTLLSVPTAVRRRSLRAVPAEMSAAISAVSEAGPTLADLAAGQTARVLSVEAPHDPAAARRMFDLGFVPGAEVKMVRRAPLADPVVFRIAGYEVALRREQARWVSVAPPAS